MTIRFSKYVDITSGVGGATVVADRQFGGLIFTPNKLVPVGGLLTITEADDAATYFGTGSEEYERALKYFAYVSPSITSPKQLQYVRWLDVGTPLQIIGGAPLGSSLAFLKTIIAGVLTLNVNGTSIPLTGINFSAAADLAGVATALQAVIRANANANLATATVAYDPVAARYTITGSSTATASATINVVAAGTGITDVGTALGLYTSTGATMSSAAPAQTPVSALINAVANSGNFGSFLFMDSTVAPITLDQIVAVAQQNATYNVMFEYFVNCSIANALNWSAALIGIASVGLIFELDALNEYPEQIPMQVLAATDFTARNGTPGYMYRSDGTTPSVTDDATSDAMDAARVNYVGQTQVNGSKLSFFQRGKLMGGATAPTDMNIHGNEAWLKSLAGARILNLQLTVDNIPANTSGLALLTSLFLQPSTTATSGDGGVIPMALYNGTISVGRALTVNQKLYIGQLTGDNNAWQVVQNKGYIFSIKLVQTVGLDGSAEWQAVYSLIYAKNDQIRSVIGTHTLI